VSATAQPFALTDLLTRAGAQIRGRRVDCPRCKRQRTVSFDESRGVYHCHGAGCDFSGGAAKLAREQGLTTRLTAAEYREVCQNRERADRAARLLYKRVKARRFELSGLLHTVNDMESAAHILGPDNPATWDALAQVCGKRPGLLAELAILENCGAADLI
jgi:ribosomal protein L37AE/L43A